MVPLARCGCGSDRCNCAVVAGPGVTVDGNGSGASPYVISATPGNATVTPGCGLTGDGSSASPLGVTVGSWPYPSCSVDTAGGQVYCDSSGVLRTGPLPSATYTQDQVNQTYPDTAVPTGTDVTIETRSLTITNPDLCREAFVIVEVELDVDFTLPPGAGAEVGIGADDMQYFANKGTTTVIAQHATSTQVYNRTIPPGATLTEQLVVTMGRGAAGATYDRIQSFIRAFVFVL